MSPHITKAHDDIRGYIKFQYYEWGIILKTTAHSIAEIWNSSDWIHADPTRNKYDNLGVYNVYPYAGVLDAWIQQNSNDGNTDIDDTNETHVLLGMSMYDYWRQNYDFTYSFEEFKELLYWGCNLSDDKYYPTDIILLNHPDNMYTSES